MKGWGRGPGKTCHDLTVLFKVGGVAIGGQCVKWGWGGRGREDVRFGSSATFVSKTHVLPLPPPTHPPTQCMLSGGSSVQSSC